MEKLGQMFVVCLVIPHEYKEGKRRIIHLDEVSFEMRLRRRTTSTQKYCSGGFREEAQVAWVPYFLAEN